MTAELIARLVLLLVMVGAGVMVIWTARAAASGRLRRNMLVGIRTATTLASDEAWLAAHRRAERSTVAAGVSSVIAGLLVLPPIPWPFAIAAVIAGSVLMLAFIGYGVYVGTRAARAES